MTLSFMLPSLPGLAWAQTALGESWPVIIEGLQNEGVDKVGDFDLRQFSKEARTSVTWKYLKRDAPSVLTGPRTSAVFIHDAEKRTNEVWVNPNLPKEATEYVPDLELHEALGALQYKDQHYRISSSLRLILDSKNPGDRKKMLKSFGDSLFKEENLRMEGGSSVGGGGDIRTLLIKKQILADIIKNEGPVSMDFLTAYQSISFEPIASDQVNYVSLHYEYRNAASIESFGPLPGVPMTNGYQEFIAVWVPMHAWETNPAERKRINKEIREKIVGLFPASPKKKSVRVLSLCGGQYKMRFPYSEDPDVVYLQESRGSALKNCYALDEQQSIEITTPALPPDAIPFSPGRYYYDCRFKLGEGEHQQLINITAGLSNMFSLRVDLEENLAAWVNIGFDIYGEGKTAHMFFYRQGEDITAAKGVHKKLKNTSDTISLPYKDQTLSFSCKRRN